MEIQLNVDQEMYNTTILESKEEGNWKFSKVQIKESSTVFDLEPDYDFVNLLLPTVDSEKV